MVLAPRPAPVTHYAELLYEAYNSEFGIWVQTNDPARLKNKLEAERAKLDDPDLSILTFRTSPLDAAQLWVMKEGKADGKNPP